MIQPGKPFVPGIEARTATPKETREEQGSAQMEGLLRALTLAALLAATTAPAQTVYKSVGPDGSVVYSDKPPADGKIDKVIEFPDLPSSPVPPDVRPLTPSEAAAMTPRM